MIFSPNGNTDFLDIVAGVLQGDSLVLFLFIIFQDYELWGSVDIMKKKGFIFKKTRSKWYLVKTMTNADYVDDPILLRNAPTQAKSLLHSLEKAAGSMEKLNIMCFKQEEVIISGNL